MSAKKKDVPPVLEKSWKGTELKKISTIDRRDLLRLLGISLPRFEKIRVNGVIKDPDKRGKYPFPEAIQKAVEYYSYHARRAGLTISYRFSAEAGARELAVDSNTLLKGFRAAAIVPGVDGKYSTLEIAKAVFGDIQSERLRRAKADADAIELENAVARKEYVPAKKMEKMFAGVCIAIRQKILASSLTHEEQDALLLELSKTKVEED